jgi:hypothetical protein
MPFPVCNENNVKFWSELNKWYAGATCYGTDLLCGTFLHFPSSKYLTIKNLQFAKYHSSDRKTAACFRKTQKSSEWVSENSADYCFLEFAEFFFSANSNEALKYFSGRADSSVHRK